MVLGMPPTLGSLIFPHHAIRLSIMKLKLKLSAGDPQNLQETQFWRADLVCPNRIAAM
jgi:hypothetical protein